MRGRRILQSTHYPTVIDRNPRERGGRRRNQQKGRRRLIWNAVDHKNECFRKHTSFLGVFHVFSSKIIRVFFGVKNDFFKGKSLFERL